MKSKKFSQYLEEYRYHRERLCFDKDNTFEEILKYLSINKNSNLAKIVQKLKSVEFKYFSEEQAKEYGELVILLDL